MVCLTGTLSKLLVSVPVISFHVFVAIHCLRSSLLRTSLGFRIRVYLVHAEALLSVTQTEARIPVPLDHIDHTVFAAGAGSASPLYPATLYPATVIDW